MLASLDAVDGARSKFAISLRRPPQEASVEQAPQSSKGKRRAMRLLDQNKSPAFDGIAHPLRDVGRGGIRQLTQEEDRLVFANSSSYGQALAEQRMPTIVDLNKVRIVGSM